MCATSTRMCGEPPEVMNGNRPLKSHTFLVSSVTWKTNASDKPIAGLEKSSNLGLRQLGDRHGTVPREPTRSEYGTREQSGQPLHRRHRVDCRYTCARADRDGLVQTMFAACR